VFYPKLFGSFLVVALAAQLSSGTRNADAAPLTPRANPRSLSLTFTQQAGSSGFVAPAPDGSLWATSLEPTASADKRILHFANGRWNGEPGYGIGISVGPNGTAYAVASDGSIRTYAYNAAASTLEPTPAGGAVGVTAAADNGFYMLSGASVVAGNAAILRRDGFGAWTHVPGMAAHIVASLDPVNYVVPSLGTITPYGYFTITASGALAHYSQTGTHVVAFPFTASAIAPVPGGFFALAYPQSPAGSQLFYFDYRTGTMTSGPYRFATISAYSPSGGPQLLYATDARNHIFSAPVAGFIPRVTFSEYPVLTHLAQPESITAGPDGAMWFGETFAGSQNEPQTGQLGRVTTGGIVNELSTTTALTPSSLPQAIAPGPDGNLWMTDFYGYLDRINRNGSLTQFPAGTFDPAKYLFLSGTGMTTAPDGNLWITMQQISFGAASGYIARHTTAGAVHDFANIGFAGFGGIVTGSDGALWFANENTIGRITTRGQMTLYASTSTNPFDSFAIVAGPDGALWFTEGYDGPQNYEYPAGFQAIGRMTTSGMVTSFPTPSIFLGGITVGPDGAIWFTEPGSNSIGRLTLAGVMTHYPLPTAGSLPHAIAPGPDGSLWFTERAGRIGRLRFHS
jgi:virginiamycin B lyase